jgi:hypothetical protein
LALLPEEHKCPDENQRYDSEDDQFAVLFHIVDIFSCFLFGGSG